MPAARGPAHLQCVARVERSPWEVTGPFASRCSRQRMRPRERLAWAASMGVVREKRRDVLSRRGARNGLARVPRGTAGGRGWDHRIPWTRHRMGLGRKPGASSQVACALLIKRCSGGRSRQRVAGGAGAFDDGARWRSVGRIARLAPRTQASPPRSACMPDRWWTPCLAAVRASRAVRLANRQLATRADMAELSAPMRVPRETTGAAGMQWRHRAQRLGSAAEAIALDGWNVFAPRERHGGAPACPRAHVTANPEPMTRSRRTGARTHAATSAQNRRPLRRAQT